MSERVDVHVHFASMDDIEHFKHALAHLTRQGNEIMSAISDFKVKQDAHNQKVSDDLDAISAAITALNALIAKLQNTPGPISPEDQKLLDDIDAAGTALATKADALAGATPPVVPTA